MPAKGVGPFGEWRICASARNLRVGSKDERSEIFNASELGNSFKYLSFEFFTCADVAKRLNAQASGACPLVGSQVRILPSAVNNSVFVE